MKLFARLRRPKKARGNILLRYGWKITLFVLLLGAVLAVFLFYGTWAQTFDTKNVGEMPERSTVYDVDGKIYSRLAGANRLKVSLSEVSPQFIAAVLAREDTQRIGVDALQAFLVLCALRRGWVPEDQLPEYRRKTTTHRALVSIAVLESRIWRKIVEVLDIRSASAGS